MKSHDLTLPNGTRVLHIGPHKTGTTAVQGAFHTARSRLPEHGVVYAGPDRQPVRAALAITGRPPMLGERPPTMADWRDLVAEVTAAGDQRVVISSEFFADAGDEDAHRVVTELGGPRVHVVVTLRPLAKILPSQWQQYVQNGTRIRYEEWLDAKFNRPPFSSPNPTFWRRHRHDQLVERWAAAAGPQNLTVVVVDETDRTMLLRAFESLVGLPGGFLAADGATANRSLTLAEIELVRALNEEFRHRGWPERLYSTHIRFGAVMQMKTGRTPQASEPRIVTPAWALERAAAISAEAAGKISALGIRVIGDLSHLTAGPAPAPAGAGAATAPALPVGAAAQAVVGAIIAGGDVDPQALLVKHRRVRDVSTAQLLRVVSERVRRRVNRTMRAAAPGG